MGAVFEKISKQDLQKGVLTKQMKLERSGLQHMARCNKWKIKIVGSYCENLKEFDVFIGEIPGAFWNNLILVGMPILYILFGTGILCYPQFFLFRYLGLGKGIWGTAFGMVMILLGIFFFITWFFMLEKLFRKDGRKRKRDHCLFLKLLFFLVWIPMLLKKAIDIILKIGRQDKIIRYFPGMGIAFLLTMLFVLLVSKGSVYVLRIPFFQQYLTVEFVSLFMVCLMIFSFFYINKKIVHAQIQAENKREDDIKIKEIFEKADAQMKYSELYFYIGVNLFLLVMHTEDVYEKMLMTAFMGITTLTALVREVKSGIKMEGK